MPSPSLIIGLGGTGSLVATYIKKELSEMIGGAWPLPGVRILAFDTDNAPPEIGLGKIRSQGGTTGAVKLVEGEFVFVGGAGRAGGTIKDLVYDVAAGKKPHIGSWLCAEFYLNVAKIADDLYSLSRGAGQFRQFGRLAVFRDVATPADSKIFGSIRDALTKIKADVGATGDIQVYIVGSLAGGTGAGMFADVAHLTRKIAESTAVGLAGRIRVRGYLVLPDAFALTVDANSLPAMHARAFAAMRENSRFTVSFDYKRGYPMYYHEGGGDALWHGALKTKLFDLLYYIDGNGEGERLSSSPIRDGVAPMIADAISAAIDSKAGDAFSTYLANVEAQRTNRITSGELSSLTSTFGSVGTYTFVLPIYSLIEGWSHDLGKEVLDVLVAPVEERTEPNRPKTLKDNANREKLGKDGETVARDFLAGTEPIEIVYREAGATIREKATPTQLMIELAKIAKLQENPAGAVVGAALSRRTLEEWRPHWLPVDDNRRALKVRANAEAEQAATLGASVLLSDPKTKVDYSDEAQRIIDEVRQWKFVHLGEENPNSGQRSGGRYGDAQKKVQSYHMDRFAVCVNFFLERTLNGEAGAAPRLAKGGKLGFLLTFLKEIDESLESVKAAFISSSSLRGKKDSSRVQAQADIAPLMQAMREAATKRSFLGGAGEARAAQDAYLGAEAKLVDILEAEAVEEAIRDTVDDMSDYVKQARKLVSDWVQTLALEVDGLYARLVDGRKQVETDRAGDDKAKCRHVINDGAYEQQRYEVYKARTNALDMVLGSVVWSTNTELVHDKELDTDVDRLVGLQLQLGPDELSASAKKDNLRTWLKACRPPFEAAARDESVIGYLRTHQEYGDPAVLAAEIHRHSGVALTYEGGNPVKANYVRAFFQQADAAAAEQYLDDMLARLGQLSGVTVLPGVGATGTQFAAKANSDDQFKFTLVFTRELIELPHIAAYKSGQREYMAAAGNESGGDRRQYHIFPAEVNAVEYERRLKRDLQQMIRLFADDVVLQLEDVEQFRLFLICFAYGLIKRKGVQQGGSGVTRSVWVLELPPEKPMDQYGNPSLPDETYLTDPMKEAALRDALMTWNFRGEDVGHGEGFAKSLDYNRASRALTEIREKDAKARVENGTAGAGDALRAMVDACQDAAVRAQCLFQMARVDRVREAFNELRTRRLPDLQTKLIQSPSPETQQELDIYSVFALMLGDELTRVRQTVNDSLGNSTSAI